MEQSNNCITSLAAGVLTLLGIEPPECFESANEALLTLARVKLMGERADRVLIYNPDAVALWIYNAHRELLQRAIQSADIQLPLRSVMPCVTPVCFASMYSGVQPERHGIRCYEKPQLTCTTLFDVLIERGMRPAIISTTGDSISQIFLGRDMEYYIYDSIEQINEKARELIERDKNELIVVYNGNYDALMHRFGPEGELSLAALRHNAESFAELRAAVEQHWRAHNTVIGFAPDHGCHLIDGGCGSHGLDMPQDMDIIHLYAALPKTE